jgi:hypothetical protein
MLKSNMLPIYPLSNMEVDSPWNLVPEDLVLIISIKITSSISITLFIVPSHSSPCAKKEIKKLAELHILGSTWDLCSPPFVGMSKISGSIHSITIIKEE